MSGYFDFSWTTNHLLYPLLYSISYCIRFYSYKQLSPNQNNPVFFSLIMGFAEISNILFELIIIYRTKQKEKRSLKFIVNNEIIKEEKEKKSEHTFFIFSFDYNSNYSTFRFIFISYYQLPNHRSSI